MWRYDNIDQVRGLVFRAELQNIKFNHDPNSTLNDAINIRQDFGTPYDISEGEWAIDMGFGSKNFPVCYVTNRSVTIQAKVVFAASTDVLTTAVVRAVAILNGQETCLGDVARTNLAVDAKTKAWDYTTYQVTGKTPASVGVAKSNALTHAFSVLFGVLSHGVFGSPRMV